MLARRFCRPSGVNWCEGWSAEPGVAGSVEGLKPARLPHQTLTVCTKYLLELDMDCPFPLQYSDMRFNCTAWLGPLFSPHCD